MDTLKYHHIVHEAKSDEEIKSLFPVYHELEPHLTCPEEMLKIIHQSSENDENCHFIYIEDHISHTESSITVPVSVLSYRIVQNLSNGKWLLINDLCTLKFAKKKGYAGALVDYAIKKATDEECSVVRLNSGHGRKDAHRFYLNRGFSMVGYHFCLEIK